jgi:hypothetical protein
MSNARSFTMLCRTPAGLGKYGSGSHPKPAVIASQAVSNRTAAVKSGRTRHIAARARVDRRCTIAASTETLKKLTRNVV